MLKKLPPLSDRLGRSGLIGGPGYTLPDTNAAIEFSFADIARSDTVES